MASSNNPGGTNQFGSYEIQPGYGDVGKQAALTRESPMSGSPFAATVLDTPRRSGRQAKSGGVRRSGTPQQGAAGPPNGATPPPTPNPAAISAQVWQQIAQTPGASPLVQQYAQQALSGG